ncbi:hypothetical protein [Variovorax sp. Root434]|uniref:hypothetical protein n=1 Tax=Variovorax sp. Root434 TaxID=1736536 RepID=UPI000B1F793D|nr:hypothetical protein [Variovorax sp. Root434]
MDTALPDAQPAPSAPIQSISFAEAFRFWLEPGFISFGGPAGRIIAIVARPSFLSGTQ